MQVVFNFKKRSMISDHVNAVIKQYLGITTSILTLAIAENGGDNTFCWQLQIFDKAIEPVVIFINRNFNKDHRATIKGLYNFADVAVKFVFN